MSDNDPYANDPSYTQPSVYPPPPPSGFPAGPHTGPYSSPQTGPHGQPPMPYGEAPSPYAPQQVHVQALLASKYATASLVFGIIGLVGGCCLYALPCMAAVVLGHVGMAETKNGRKSGRGSAIAGLILGYVVVIPAILICVYFVLGGTIGSDRRLP
ncbi:DUF4190 domain-containing protein [Planotetraspora kaengkrachanensis]|uniref:DUF4190 domain-containing protein n=1 Tax=Planotetraspora kaengkrachanensis TaxID=575193 RepID=A0A8J3V7L1_9ACTN|nr:DUF4190 domain-containing protein [Planotetraspora kaengkrachanensis]GIG81433.1 hypothetical protein Pka01_45600 [Planotetraspora kaengkrachanensis]